MVRESDCGLLLDGASPEAVAQAIDTLADPSLRRRLGDNGLRAAQTRYNASAMQEQLAAVYARLEGS
jgi:glycosyltransferase involved in cell wall biosynthesis